MISDNDLYRLAIFLGSCAMMLIVFYHFLDVNAHDDEETTAPKPVSIPADSTVSSDKPSGTPSTTKAK
ncbi:uncharacterized protein N7483_011758 [Penicillium malachiteum]|uniref:uncharacterized protein n=1 Tax=Penicillium malachiteum TaxID=1324776 RepID=UPI002548151D|nr:uncharacterized protein N7483_011758 [Penicillium malachiteum]KAJ5714577.1 hypothetical protein N7483_011758 [Penicillium malachiteum]